MAIFTHWPNRITAIRFVGSLVLFALLHSIFQLTPEAAREQRDSFTVAFWLFVVVAATDALDGYLARRDHHVTAFGRIADPFTDKVLILGTMIFMTSAPWSEDWLPPWVVVLILSREFLVTGIRGYVESQGGEFPADWWGKAKMILQCIAVGNIFWLYAFDWSEDLFRIWGHFATVFVWGTVLSTVLSGVMYIVRTRRILKELGG